MIPPVGLFLDTIRIVSSPGQPPGETHVRQVLHLSDDLKRLSIRTERDSYVFPRIREEEWSLD